MYLHFQTSVRALGSSTLFSASLGSLKSNKWANITIQHHTAVELQADFDRSSPGSRWEHSLQFIHAAVHSCHEVDVGERCGYGHGLCAVFIVYPEVCAAGITSPAHRKVQRSGLDALSGHLWAQISNITHYYTNIREDDQVQISLI